MKRVVAQVLGYGMAGFGLIALSACGVDLESDNKNNKRTESKVELIPVTTSCEVIESPDGIDPANAKLARYHAPEGTLRLSITDLPMTCADNYLMHAYWEKDAPGLTLDIQGDRYMHCLCSIDFKPFNIAVPEPVIPVLKEAAVSVIRGDAEDVDLLKPMVIGEIPYADEE